MQIDTLQNNTLSSYSDEIMLKFWEVDLANNFSASPSNENGSFIFLTVLISVIEPLKVTVKYIYESTYLHIL